MNLVSISIVLLIFFYFLMHLRIIALVIHFSELFFFFFSLRSLVSKPERMRTSSRSDTERRQPPAPTSAPRLAMLPNLPHNGNAEGFTISAPIRSPICSPIPSPSNVRRQVLSELSPSSVRSTYVSRMPSNHGAGHI